MDKKDFLSALSVEGENYYIYDIMKIEKKGIADIKRLPFSIKILVENLLRKMDGKIVSEDDLLNIARWQKSYENPVDIPYHPARVLMQDFTGVPAVVDLAAMRDAVKNLGGDPKKINPLVPTELIIDHSIQVDYYGTGESLTQNVETEYKRNKERYELLKWAQKNFDNFKVVPPNSGICHQVNLEHLGRVIINENTGGKNIAFPDTLIGTDSHTTMINGIGIMAWGVGGIEAEAVMLGQPYYMLLPEVIGVELTGEPGEGVTATDLVLTITELLRQQGVVEKFVEFFGAGMKNLKVPDRATIANMSPEYGATMGFFPVDEKTIDYLKITGRGKNAGLVEQCSRRLGLYYEGHENPEYTKTIRVDLSTVEPSIAGPSRPQDRINIKDVKNRLAGLNCGVYRKNANLNEISTFHDESGTHAELAGDKPAECGKMVDLTINGRAASLGDRSVVIAAITSCTNTSNPHVLIGAGLLAKNAVKMGLKVPPYVKTSFAPGSRVVSGYMENSGLMPYLESLGFFITGFGCTTCIGNSGPLQHDIEKAITDNDLSVAAVLSGNRNFEARIHQKIKENYLASPMLVVVYALAGRIDTDLTKDPIAMDPNSRPVYMKDIWPAKEEITKMINSLVSDKIYESGYKNIFLGDDSWKNLPITEGETFNWDESSTYIKNPPYFENFDLKLSEKSDIEGARPLLLLGDSITTDHISPAGAIPRDYPAGKYLISKNVKPENFNSYGSRRGNDDLMTRGSFGNIRIKNRLVSPREGSYTIKFPEKKETFIFDASTEYMTEGTPLIVLGGREYGTGSSRDWAAKGTALLGIKAVIA